MVIVVAALIPSSTTVGARAGGPSSSPASVGVPLAAELLAQPYQSTGVRVNVTGLGNLRGLANDGTNVYALDATGNVVVVALSSIDMTPGGSVTVPGAVRTVGWGVGGAPAMPDLSKLSLSYSHGCLFITDGTNSVGSIGLYCIDTTTFEVAAVAVPAAHPLPAGFYYVESSLIDFPDGRIGKVSAYEPDGNGGYLSTLRTYTVDGTGTGVTIAWSEDYLMADPVDWATDEHGIATDGTYLYRIQWNSFVPNTKVWALQSGAPAPVFTSSQYTMPYGNMHFLSHNHLADYYLVGHWDHPDFFLTTAADPGPGPGRPLVPTFGPPTPTADGYTVQITNHDAAFGWSGTATAGGVVSIDANGLMTVTGVAPGTASTVTVSAARSGYPTGSAPVTGTAAPPAPSPTTTSPTTTIPATPPTTSPTTARPALPEPVRLPDGSLPSLRLGDATATLDGVDDAVTVRPDTARTGVAITGDGFRLVIAGVDASGARVPLTAAGHVLLRPGRFAEVSGEGFAPGTPVDVWVFSTPSYLGRLIVGSDGSFRGSLPIPVDLPAGVHTLQANGTAADGRSRSIALGVEVASAAAAAPVPVDPVRDPTRPAALAFTGADTRTVWFAGVGLLALGAVAVLGRRRLAR